MNPEDPQSSPPPEQPAPQPSMPLQPPPGYMPPPGYPPLGTVPGYGAQQPPPPGGYPPPGYPPPGYPPPGYMPPVYYAPAPYVPPAVYHVPAADGRPPQMVPPASGTLWQAWFSIATRPSRQNIAAWAQIATASWVRTSVIVAAALQAVYAIVIVAGIYGIVTSALAAASTTTSVPSVSFVDFLPGFIGAVLFFPLIYLASFFAIPFGQALFMSNGLGTIRQRYVRALKPWALAQVGLIVATLIFGVLLMVLALVILTPTFHDLFASIANNGTTPPSAFISALFSLLGVIFLIAIPLSVYQYMMQIQSGAVGAAMNRWAIFGINLLTGLVVGVGFNIIIQIFNVALLSHLTSPFIPPVVTPSP